MTNETPTEKDITTTGDASARSEEERESLVDRAYSVLTAHADCGIVNVDTGSPIRFTCGGAVPRPGPDSTVGWVELHRRHVADAVALADPLSSAPVVSRPEAEMRLAEVIRTERERHKDLSAEHGVFSIVCSCGYKTFHVSRRDEWEQHVDENVAAAILAARVPTATGDTAGDDRRDEVTELADEWDVTTFPHEPTAALMRQDLRDVLAARVSTTTGDTAGDDLRDRVAALVDENLIADIADFVHTARVHGGGPCHGDNDGCEGGPDTPDHEACDSIVDCLLDAARAASLSADSEGDDQ